MGHYLATYIDLIQTIGFVFILASIIVVVRKLSLENQKDKNIEFVRIRVDS